MKVVVAWYVLASIVWVADGWTLVMVDKDAREAQVEDSCECESALIQARADGFTPNDQQEGTDCDATNMHMLGGLVPDTQPCAAAFDCFAATPTGAGCDLCACARAVTLPFLDQDRNLSTIFSCLPGTASNETVTETFQRCASPPPGPTWHEYVGPTADEPDEVLKTAKKAVKRAERPAQQVAVRDNNGTLRVRNATVGDYQPASADINAAAMMDGAETNLSSYVDEEKACECRRGKEGKERMLRSRSGGRKPRKKVMCKKPQNNVLHNYDPGCFSLPEKDKVAVKPSNARVVWKMSVEACDAPTSSVESQAQPQTPADWRGRHGEVLLRAITDVLRRPIHDDSVTMTEVTVDPVTVTMELAATSDAEAVESGQEIVEVMESDELSQVLSSMDSQCEVSLVSLELVDLSEALQDGANQRNVDVLAVGGDDDDDGSDDNDSNNDDEKEVVSAVPDVMEKEDERGDNTAPKVVSDVAGEEKPTLDKEVGGGEIAAEAKGPESPRTEAKAKRRGKGKAKRAAAALSRARETLDAKVAETSSKQNDATAVKKARSAGGGDETNSKASSVRGGGDKAKKAGARRVMKEDSRHTAPKERLALRVPALARQPLKRTGSGKVEEEGDGVAQASSSDIPSLMGASLWHEDPSVRAKQSLIYEQELKVSKHRIGLLDEEERSLLAQIAAVREEMATPITVPPQKPSRSRVFPSRVAT